MSAAPGRVRGRPCEHEVDVDAIFVWLAALFVAGLVAGLVIGRWWALALALLVPLGFVPAGDDADGAPEWQTALFLLAPFALAGLAVGIAVRSRAR